VRGRCTKTKVSQETDTNDGGTFPTHQDEKNYFLRLPVYCSAYGLFTKLQEKKQKALLAVKEAEANIGNRTNKCSYI